MRGEKRKKKKRKHPFTSNHHQTHFILLISWGACSQSALPLKSYREAENHPMWDSRCIDSKLSSTKPKKTNEKKQKKEVHSYT